LIIENLPAGRQVEKQITMSQDNMIKMECGDCRRVNYFSRKNKKILKERLLLKKFCKHCGKHTSHKETK